MDIQNAVEMLKNESALTFYRYPALNEAVKLAIAALKKQIPQRPDFEGDGYDENGIIILDTWFCPCCEEMYETDYDVHKHCPNCGQAIDWSDYND